MKFYIIIGAISLLLLLVTRLIPCNPPEETLRRDLLNADEKQNRVLQKGGEKNVSASFAASLVTPVLPDIIALGREMQKGQIAYDAVRQGLFALPRELSQTDAKALLDLLLGPAPADWNELGWAAIVNDGFNVLRQGKNQAPDFMARLIACHRDSRYPLVIRDYALQHFGTQLVVYYSDPQGRGQRLFGDTALRNEAQQVLRQALCPGKGTSMGTACNVVDDILSACARSGEAPPFALEEICRSCAEIALCPTENIHARLTALGLLGRHQSPLLLKEARHWMGEDTQPVLLRAAAINYVGRFSYAQDVPLMTSLAAHTDLRLSYPAKRSLARIETSPPSPSLPTTTLPR